ncbi:ADP-ribosylglycohydrolase [Alloscardovia macacae]|uniref:ADP-ribosylglycohydrolase n=2 Tax=Alloscardovia macacae TaxID=1160091 RepID=A0A1Y2STB3_9BIFI|nr:ADP-ribosylglycohydrolase [Alloscardovia macacae]OTA29914.1 ADP-ribosylglycohydrolase [Alloscardovia macacae]
MCAEDKNPEAIERECRAVGALLGLALGDALGMPTQSMSEQEIRAIYGHIDRLRDAIAEQPIAPNMPAGSVTDDTEQALLVGELIVDGAGHITPLTLAHRLLDWEDDMVRRGSLDLLGPSTKYALEQIRQGADSRTTGRTGTTNGAAMRVTPVGIANSTRDLDRFAERVYESCKVTHNTVDGFTAASLVAGAVSLGIDGASTREALTGALELMEALQEYMASFECAWSAKADVVARARAALALAQRPYESEGQFLTAVRLECGTSVESNESIPAAFALAWYYADRPFEAVCGAASLGGDTDTMGAICGAICGASGGAEKFPQSELQKIEEVAHLDVTPLAHALLEVREK